jgi:hypothetical protein
MASVADILFGNKKRMIETGQKAKTRENQFGDDDEVSKRPLTQDRINQLLGKKTIQPKNQISESKVMTNFNNNIHKPLIKKEIPKSHSVGSSSTLLNKDRSNQMGQIKVPSKINTKQEKLYNNLRTFKNINEIFEEVDKNKDYDKIFLDSRKEKEESIAKSSAYKPVSACEEKSFKTINDINKLNESEELRMLGKKHKMNSSQRSGSDQPIQRSMNLGNISYSDKDVWCSKCKRLHASDYHKLPEHVNMKKIFGGEKNSGNNESKVNSTNKLLNGVNSNNKKVSVLPIEKGIERIKSLYPSVDSSREGENRKITNNYKNEKIIGHNPQQKIHSQPKKNEFPISYKTLCPNTKNSSQANNSTPISNNKPIISKSVSIEDKISQLKNRSSHPVGGGDKFKKPVKANKSYTEGAMFSREDFEEEDDFIVDDEDDDNVDYRRHLLKINSRLMRRGHGYYHKNDGYSDEDLEEAGFDQIQDEEEKTARIGEQEDWIEEQREQLEKELIERRRRKYN